MKEAKFIKTGILWAAASLFLLLLISLSVTVAQEGVSLPQNLQPITLENADQIEQLAAFEQEAVCTATFSPTNDLLAYGGRGAIVLQDIVDGTVVNTLQTENRSIISIAFSPDGQLMAAISTWMSTCGKGVIQVWDMDSGELRLQLLDEFEHDPTSVVFNSDGTLLAASTACVFDVAGSATIKVWDTATGTLILDITAPTGVTDVVFSPDGALLASSHYDGIIRLWEVATGALVSGLHGHTVHVWSLAFSPDGTRLVAGGYSENETSARLWDVASGEQLNRFEGHSEGVSDVAFNADGRLVVTGGVAHSNRTIAFWDAATGALLAVREVGDAADNYFFSLAFNADSTLLAICEHDEMLRLWGVPADK